MLKCAMTKTLCISLRTRPYNPTYNMSIWHVTLRGVDSPDIVEDANKDYTNVRADQ